MGARGERRCSRSWPRGALWLLRPSDTLARDVVAHVQGEPQSWLATQHVDAQAIATALHGAGVALDLTSDQIIYAQSCWFRGHYVPHLVVETAHGPATVLILRHEHVDGRRSFDERGHGRGIVPAGSGSIAVLERGGGNSGNLEQLAQQMQRDVRWLPDGQLKLATMGGINRRDLFMAAGSLFAALLARRAARAAAASIPPAPVARVEVVKDTYFGETLSDPYRWMENDQDPAWLPFLQGQNAHARAVLDTIPASRPAADAHRAALRGRGADTRRGARAAAGCSSSSARWAPTISSCSCAQNGATRVLIDPTRLSRYPRAHVARLVASRRRTARTSSTGCRRTAARTRCCMS